MYNSIFERANEIVRSFMLNCDRENRWKFVAIDKPILGQAGANTVINVYVFASRPITDEDVGWWAPNVPGFWLDREFRWIGVIHTLADYPGINDFPWTESVAALGEDSFMDKLIPPEESCSH